MSLVFGLLNDGLWTNRFDIGIGFAILSILEAALITAAVRIDVDSVGLKTLFTILSAFLGIAWIVSAVCLIGGPADLESSIEDELTKGLLPKNKD